MLQNREQVRQWMTELGISRVLVVSPHMDDAVLSLGELLRHLAECAEVLTVFTESDPQTGLDWARRGGFRDSAEEHAARRQEDILAQRHLGVSHRHAGVRSGELTGSLLSQHLPGWLGAPSPAEQARLLVLLPGGCGGKGPESLLSQWVRRLTRRPFAPMPHLEHVLVRDMFRVSPALGSVRLGFYAELPYAWRQNDPMIRSDLSRLTGQSLELVRLQPDVSKKLVAVEHYRSQVGLILGDSPAYRKRVLARPETLFLLPSHPVLHAAATLR